jgi:hypothetical protein
MDDDCHYSRYRIVEVKTTMNFPSILASSASATIDQRQRRRRQLHRRHAAVHCHHPANPFLRRISTPSSSSTFYFLVALIALSMSTSSYAFSTSSSSSTKPLTISPTSSSSSRNTGFGKSIKNSTKVHQRISPSWLPSPSRKRTSQHNLSAVADVPKSSSPSSSPSSPSSNSFQSRMEKLVRRNNSENNKLNNTNNSRQYRNDDHDEDSAGKYSQYGNYNGSSSRWSSSLSNYNNLKTVHTLLEYKQVLDECRREGNKGGKIVVVRFFATWCKVRSSSSCHSSVVLEFECYSMLSPGYLTHPLSPHFTPPTSSLPGMQGHPTILPSSRITISQYDLS